MTEPASGGVRVELEGVPETLLWTLYHRALEARRADAVLRDPVAVDLVDRIDYPFAERFGAGTLAQWQALRVRAFDREVRRFLAAHPGGTVVALGEGLETQFWRVDDGRVRWIGVDLPETVAVRRRLLPDPPRGRTVARSALDASWMDEIDASRGVLLTAQGLLMYFEPDDVHRLVARCASRFPGGALVFDAVPRWLAERTRRPPDRDDGAYRPPPWHWTLDGAERRRLEALPGVEDVRAIALPRGRGVVHGFALPIASRLEALQVALLTVLRARFRSA
jgi:O-methyltransferase involved in polyketide biosynthesis